MGWLRDLMSQAELRSFGDLARKALAHPDWPSDNRAQPRSLEAILGRLDRKLDLDWLADRPGVQQVLAALLNSQVAEIRTVIVGTTPAKGPVYRLRLDSLPMARSFDLQHEALPPTVPERIGLPATWNRLAWIAPSGSGASLAQKWLVSRGLAQGAYVESLEAYRALPIQGPPLFLKVDQDLALRIVEEYAQHQPVCLAVAANGPSKLDAFERHGFEILHSESATENLERLVDWALARCPQGAQARREPLLSWLSAGPQSFNILETLGDVLGCVGLALAEETGSLPPLSKEALLREWLSLRAENLAKERFRDVLALGQLLPEALLELAQVGYLDDGRALLSPRRLEDWLAMVAPQHQRGSDMNWLSAHLGAEYSTLRPRELERLAQRLPPGAHRIIVALRELGLLRPASTNSFSLRPHFFARLLHSLATERTASSQPVFWGEALLKPNTRPPLLLALQKRVAIDPESVADELLEMLDAESAPLVSALESGYVLLGLEVLTSAELSEQAAASLLEEQNALLLGDWSVLPQRRTAPLRSPLIEDSEGAFFLASFALAELCKARHKPVSVLLDPWRQTAPPSGWAQVLDAIATTVRLALEQRPRWLAGALRLLERLRQILGTGPESQIGGHSSPHHELFAAAILLDAVELGVVEVLEPDLLQADWQLELFFETARVRERSTLAILRALSLLLPSAEPATLCRWLRRTPHEFWSVADPESIAPLLRAPGLDEGLIPWSELTAATWSAWSHQRLPANGAAESVVPWRHAPDSVGSNAVLSSTDLSLPVCGIVWERWPELAAGQIERHRTVRPAIAVKWLTLAPPSAIAPLAQAAMAHEWHKADSRVRNAVLQRLHEGIGLRLPGWSVAYDCLHRFETERRRY